MSEMPLFIANGQRGIGVITAAEIRIGRNTGNKYIWATVDVGSAEEYSCIITRAQYTLVVLRQKWGREVTDEEQNVAALVGAEVQVRYEHTIKVDGKAFVGLYINSITKRL